MQIRGRKRQEAACRIHKRIDRRHQHIGFTRASTQIKRSMLAYCDQETNRQPYSSAAVRREAQAEHI